MIDWRDMESGEFIKSVDDMPSKTYGFVYLIEFMDGTKYIGKKNLYTVRLLKTLKSGKPREGTIRQIKKNTNKGGRISYDLVKAESNWKEYTGSSKECEGRIPKNRYILDYALSKRHLTYLEAKCLFQTGAIEKSHFFLNSNILGTFFKGNLIGNEDEEETD